RAGAARRRPAAGPRGAAGLARRPRGGALQDRVRPAGAARAQRRPGPRPLHDLRPDLGLRLRPRVEEPRGLHQLPAPQAGRAGRAAADPDGPGRRLHAAPPGGVSTVHDALRRLGSPGGWRLGTKFAALFALVTAVVGLLMGTLGYSTAALLIRSDAQKEFEATTAQLASELSRPSLSPGSGGTLNFLHSDSFTYQGLSSSGAVSVPIGEGKEIEVLPVRPADRAVAAEQAPGTVRTRADARTGEQYRIATVSIGDGRGAIQIGQRLSPVVRMLDVLALQILGVGALVVLCAAVAGWLVSRRVTGRLVRLTETA